MERRLLNNSVATRFFNRRANATPTNETPFVGGVCAMQNYERMRVKDVEHRVDHLVQHCPHRHVATKHNK